MMKRETFPIAKIYVPAKRRATLDVAKAREIAESILKVGQQTPIMVRRDGDRFVLVEGLIRRFRYLDETIAIVLGIVAIKLLIEDLYKAGPVTTLVVVFVAFTIGIIASVIADKRDPDAEAKREERTESLSSS